MLKKNWFYLTLLLIFILYLVKDNLFGINNNLKQIENSICNIQNKELVSDYEELLKITNLEPKENNLIYSKVIMREIGEFYDKITINKGIKEGIKKGDLVINENGVVGIIKNSKNHYSEVSLITSKETNLSVKIRDSYGILSSKDNKLYVKNIKIEGEISEGDEVVTSGLTSIPEGIKIGKVSNVTKDHLELEYILDIEHNPLQSIKYVGVISI